LVRRRNHGINISFLLFIGVVTHSTDHSYPILLQYMYCRHRRPSRRYLLQVSAEQRVTVTLACNLVSSPIGTSSISVAPEETPEAKIEEKQDENSNFRGHMDDGRMGEYEIGGLGMTWRCRSLGVYPVRVRSDVPLGGNDASIGFYHALRSCNDDDDGIFRIAKRSCYYTER
jgi:hypothetical protein